MRGSDVVFTTGSINALDVLLSSWPGERSVACLARRVRTQPRSHGRQRVSIGTLPADDLGRLAVDDAARDLADDPPALVHLTAFASHRGLAQPLAELAGVCRELGVPLVVDAAQAMGHLDCAVDAAAYSARHASGWQAHEASACWRFVRSSRSS